LIVEVISADKLLPLDYPSPVWDICRKIHPSSDPRVEIDVLVQGRSGDGMLRKTKTHKKTLNPTFGETFEFFLERDAVESPSTVVRFTVKDVDVLSVNDFMGEALVPLARVIIPLPMSD